MAQMAGSSSPAFSDSILYHRYLKGQSLYSETNASTAASEETLTPSAYHWDLQETCKPMLDAFDYVSTKLSQEGLSIHLIISDQHPSVIPVWHLPHKSQVTLCKIVRKACQKYDPAPSWMTALASLPKRDLPEVFEAFKPDAYVIRRSMLQREVVYSSEGLTLLSIDHIFTLKQLLRTLSKREWMSGSRESCVDSCVHLLHRIHSVYTGKPASAAYIERVYKEVPYQEAELDEVIVEYNARYCTASIYEVDFQPKFQSAHHDDYDYKPADRPTSSSTFQLPEPSHPPRVTSLESFVEYVSPIEVDLDMVRIWDAIPLSPDPSSDDGLPSPSSVTYPSILKPSSTPPLIPPIATASQVPFPPPPSPPPTYPLPPPPSLPYSPPSTSSTLYRSPPLSSRSTTLSTYSDSSDAPPDLPPAPLKITKRASTNPATSTAATFPLPPGYRGDALPLLASTVFTDTGSAVDGEALWEVNVLDSPRSYIESWSSMTEGALCERCHEVVVAVG